ncbi:protein kinase [Streptomyces sp. NPDC006458]|uniref:serine/threonine-protein kinase n=1 Tax=Streptomyces sp. NPDC006458 TaxID=3154302 RepID=UPI0033A2F752
MGEVFAGRYELADPIGRGGVGAVWRAWDHRRRRYVAAKVLQQRDAHSLLRFVREQALRIDHPHVLAPASWAADDDKVLFTMDLVAGGSLVRLVGDYGPLPPVFVATLVDQLLSGLAAVHAEGVVHRDIKPANLLLEATGTGRPRLRLSDFGIAMRLGEPRLTETNLVVGTPGYLAPEQLQGAEPDFPADLFAVGLVALYLLEGAKPDAKALVDYFTVHGTPGAPTGIPEPLWQIVATLLQPDPQARFRTATGARKALASATELLPEPGADDELIEIFDQLGPLPSGFGPTGPLRRAPGVEEASGEVSGTTVRAGLAGSPSSSPSLSPSRGTGTGSVPDDPRQSTGSVPGPGRAAGPHDSGSAAQISMSDTGSFHLPPPLTGSRPQPFRQPSDPAQHQPPTPTGNPAPTPADVRPRHQPVHGGHQHPQAPPPPPRPVPAPSVPTPYRPAQVPFAPQPRIGGSTASYTARDSRVPTPAQEDPQPAAAPAARTDGQHRRRRRRRPGPPPKVTVPVLLLALVCYAVGFWALTRI